MKFDYKIFDQILRIIDFLEDDVSKIVFKQRVLSNISNDVSYILDMLKLTQVLDVNKAYDSYKVFEEHYNLYSRLDVLAWLGNKKKKKNVFLFGAGRNCQNYIDLLSAAQISVSAVIDNNSMLTAKDGIPVLRAAGNEEILRDSYIIITSVIYRDEIYQQLCRMNISEGDIFYPGENALISYNQDVYFDPDIWKMRDKEIFIDAGCYNLFTSFIFSRMCPDYEKIYAFEPDGQNFELCKKNEDKYSLSSVELVNAGLWEEETTLRFVHQGDLGGGSCVSETGNVEVKVTSLDKYLKGNQCTLIKMDIEGSELSALKGAEQTIKKWKPRLAICVYHKPEDIFEIPLYIKSLVPEYKIKLRHYSTYFYDTILYAYTDNK